MKKLIGLSLSRCCEDMARGEVNPDHVKVIISGTSIWNPEKMEKTIEWYKDTTWDPEIAERATKLFRRFFAEGKVEQPRNTHGRCPDFDGYYWGHPARPHWITNKKRIVWKKSPPAPKD